MKLALISLTMCSTSAMIAAANTIDDAYKWLATIGIIVSGIIFGVRWLIRLTRIHENVHARLDEIEKKLGKKK